MKKNVEDVFVRTLQSTDELELRQALWSLELTIDAIQRSTANAGRTALVKTLAQLLTDYSDKV